MSEFDEFIADLQSRGEEAVRVTLSQGGWANRRKKWAEDWLDAKETSRAVGMKTETLSLAAEGNATARGANRIAEKNLQASRSSRNAAWVAAIAAIIAAVSAVIAYLQAKP